MYDRIEPQKKFLAIAQKYQTPNPLKNSHNTHPAYIIITTGTIVMMLRIGLGLLKNLHDLVRAFILPRIFPVDLVRTYGKSVSIIIMVMLIVLIMMIRWYW